MLLTALIFFLASAAGTNDLTARSTDSSVSVTVATDNSGATTTYRYMVTHRAPGGLAHVAIGLSPGAGEPELSVKPVGWDLKDNTCPASVAAPKGWRGCVGLQEESDLHWIDVDTEDPKFFLQPGSDMTIQVTVPTKDPAYEHASFWAIGTSSSRVGKVAPGNRTGVGP